MKKNPWLLIRRLNWFLLTLLIVMGLFGQRGWLDLKRMENENRRLQSLIDETEKQNHRLELEIAGLNRNPHVQEQTIRQVLGYIRPDESVIEF